MESMYWKRPPPPLFPFVSQGIGSGRSVRETWTRPLGVSEVAQAPSGGQPDTRETQEQMIREQYVPA